MKKIEIGKTYAGYKVIAISDPEPYGLDEFGPIVTVEHKEYGRFDTPLADFMMLEKTERIKSDAMAMMKRRYNERKINRVLDKIH